MRFWINILDHVAARAAGSVAEVGLTMMPVSGMRKKLRGSGPFQRTALVPLMLVVVAAFACPARAGTGSPPDSARIVRVRLDLLPYHDVQIVTDSAKVLARDPSISSDGLWLRFEAGRWGITSSSTPAQLRLVPWAEIDAIRARKGAIGNSVVMGSMTGLVIGSGIALGQALTHPSSKGTPIVWGVLGGALFGWLVDRPGPWNPIYP